MVDKDNISINNVKVNDEISRYEELKELVYSTLKKRKIVKSYTFNELIEKMGIIDLEDIDVVRNILVEGTNSWDLYEYPGKDGEIHYKHMSKTNFRKGVFHANKSGGGTVLVTTVYDKKDGEHVVDNKTYKISPKEANGAINNDEVLIGIDLKDSENLNAVVERVADRKLENLYGEVYMDGSAYFVKPCDPKLKNLIISITGDGVEKGDLVDVRLTKQTADNFYIGEVVDKLEYKSDAPDYETLKEAFMHGITDKFSDESHEQLKTLPDHVLPTDYIGRQDLTREETVTLDGADTNDMDDAFGIKELPNGNFELTVSIADVDNYVPFNSPIDLDARRKGNSTYLAGKVIPMLFFELSKGICSLNPNVDRLALSVRMEIDKNTGEVVRHDVFKSVIHSNMKMAYHEVNEILKTGKLSQDNSKYEEYKKYKKMLLTSEKCALSFRKRRLKRGALDIKSVEMKHKLDENYKSLGPVARTQDIAENLIEEFMIATNITICKDLNDKVLPCPYRVHDKPNEKKVQELFDLFMILGIDYHNYSAEECVTNPKAMQDVVDFVKDEKFNVIYNALYLKVVTCLSKAKYSPDNIGHSALVEPNYCHFTSPIRRYADLIVHRIVKEALIDGKDPATVIKKWEKILPEICENISKTERSSDECERDNNQRLNVEYMSQFNHGETFKATITNIGSSGMTLQLDNMIEGSVKQKQLDGDYKFNPPHTAISLDGKDDYHIGDRVLVKVASTSENRRTISFKIVDIIEKSNLVGVDEENQKVKSLANDERYRRKNKIN